MGERIIQLMGTSLGQLGSVSIGSRSGQTGLWIEAPKRPWDPDIDPYALLASLIDLKLVRSKDLKLGRLPGQQKMLARLRKIKMPVNEMTVQQHLAISHLLTGVMVGRPEPMPN